MTKRRWKTCANPDCKKQGKRFRKHGNKLYCYQCYQKIITIMPGRKRGSWDLKEALSREYEIKGYMSKKGYLGAFRSFPSILIGHKVKLVLVKEK